MKKTNWILILSGLTVAAGLMAKPYSKLMCICMVLVGLIVFFGTLAVALRNQTEKRCPACGQRIHVSMGQYNRIHSGMIPCPRCGVLVRVDHVTPR